METVEHAIWLPYPPETIFTVIIDPHALARIVGRINRAEVVEQLHDYAGKLHVEIDLPARQVFDTIGDVSGRLNEYLVFETHEPFPLKFTWTLSPENQNGTAGTHVHGTLGFDLSAYGLPGAGMLVRGIVQGELQEDLARLADELKARNH